MQSTNPSFLLFFPLKYTFKQIRDLSVILSIITVFLAVYQSNYYLLLLLLPFVIGGFLYQPLLFIPAFFWFGISNLLGYVSGKIILSAIFILFVVPVGLARKLLKIDNLMLSKGGSGWRKREHTYDTSDMEKPF